MNILMKKNQDSSITFILNYFQNLRKNVGATETTYKQKAHTLDSFINVLRKEKKVLSRDKSSLYCINFITYSKRVRKGAL